MCELMTLAAAIFATVLFAAARRAGRPCGAMGTTALALWGAALMWGVDCVRSYLDGEGLFDLSAGDAALGGLILACAALLYAVLRVRERTAQARGLQRRQCGPGKRPSVPCD